MILNTEEVNANKEVDLKKRWKGELKLYSRKPDSEAELPKAISIQKFV